MSIIDYITVGHVRNVWLVFGLFDESDEEVWAELEISKVEWKVLSGVQMCLEKVQVTSRSLESDTSPTSHLVVTKLFELEHCLIKFMTTLSNDR